MTRLLQLCLLCALVLALTASLALAQSPVGTISGVVSDDTGAVIPNASVTIKNKATDLTRQLVTSSDGSYSAPSLPAGQYEVRVEVKGFRTVVREATVETGATTTSDMRMSVGATTEVVNVEAASAQISYDSNTIDGVITRQKIQGLPLNGRSFLNLASIEPGVTVGTGSTSQYNAQFSVSILGADAGRTSYTVDGGNIRDSIEGTGPGMNFSQEVVQEFQLSSVNFDLSTGITAVGSVNVVTRSGGNDFHGSGYFYFRDHNMAAYPALQRNPFNLNPFFARRNPGFWVGGPIIKDKLFFFFNYEYQNQSSAVTFQPNTASLASLANVFTSPYKGKTLSARFDYKLNQSNTLFARYSHDGNTSVGPTGGSGSSLPSNWVVNTNWSDLSTIGITTTLKPTLINDFRVNYQYWHNRNLFPDNSLCGGACLGLDDIAAQISVNSTNVTIGHSTNATQGRDLRKFQFDDGLTWQKGGHRLRVGGQIELAPGSGFWGYCDPMCGGVASTETVQSLAALGVPVAALFPTLPKQVKTYQDFLNLPFLYAVIGIGDPSQPPPYNVDTAKKNNRFRLYAQDTWKLTSHLTLNYGLAWEYESNLFNHDLTKPQYLAPVYGTDLSPTNNNHGNFSPVLGFAYNLGHDNKTVIRGGAGIYYDSEYLYQRLQERAYIGPIGNGRIQEPNSAIINTFPGIFDISAGVKPIPVGSPLPYAHLTNLTFGQFISLYKAQIAGLTAALAPKDLNNLTVRNIDISKTGTQLYPKDYPLIHAYHMNFGVQRQLSRDMVLSVDYARRVFNNVDLGEVDQNRYNRYINGVQTPVIPKCTGAQAATPGFECSTGPITFWTPAGKTSYNGLLVKLDKRFAKRYQFTASYALTDQHGYNGIYNYNQYNSSWGPQLARQRLTLSGIVDLPWGFQLGLISTMSGKSPTEAIVSGVDLIGSGAQTNTPLPGLSFNCLNRGCSNSDLAAAVASWNSTYAGKADAIGKVIPKLILPANYTTGRNFNSQDVRLTKTFTLKERYRFSVFGEMFNVLNYFNPTGISSTVDQVNSNPANQTFSFGQPTGRFGQVFGSGGPRAVQVGGRFTF
jgi:hypothetical protein